MLTIAISNNHAPSDLEVTLKNIADRCGDSELLQIIVLNFIDGGNYLLPSASLFSENRLTFIDAVSRRPSEVYAEILPYINGDYVLFSNSGDVFGEKFFSVVHKFISAHGKGKYPKKYSDIAALNINYAEYSADGGAVINTDDRSSEFLRDVASPIAVDLEITPDMIPLDPMSVLFKTSVLKEVGINTSLTLDALKCCMYALLNRSCGYIRLGLAEMVSAYPRESDKINFMNMHETDWYFHSLSDFILPMLKACKNGETVRKFIQYAALYELRWRFVYNLNNDNKHIVDKDFDKFKQLCHDILSEIDTGVILNVRNNKLYKMNKGLCLAMLALKHNETLDTNYLLDTNNILRTIDDIVLMKSSGLSVILEIIEFENNKLSIEASIDDFMDMTKCRLNCFVNNKTMEIIPTYRYAHTKYFGVSVNKRYTFKIEIPYEKIKSENLLSISFTLSYNDFSVVLPMATRRYTSKISSYVPLSYWMFDKGKRVMFFNQKCRELIVTGISKLGHVKKEIHLLLKMLHGNKKSYQMFFTRLMYWITKPYFRRKKIWLTYDKLYKGGDCGEYFYKYMLSRNDGITPAYVINRDSEDAQRLKSEGYKPLYYGTLKTRLYYLNADAVFATHGGVHTFNGLSNWQVRFVQDLIHADVTCIQHGLSVQQLAQELNQVYNNTKRYYCASKYEIKNLEHPIYGYEDKSVLRLTGIPRYDGLINNDKRQILITPTWRAYISMPPVMGQSRPYFPGFKETNYYKIYYNLLTDERLIQTARKTGYKLIYLLHPIISAQIVDYPNIENVEIIPASTVNYEKILTESSLMLTDYSGVQFDFAYMRKPVVYYHPPKLPPHYKEGGFFYDSMGFGEICTEHDEMVNCLCEYMENDCKVKPFYLERQDDFFAYSDHNSCKRIYDDMIDYQKNKNK